MTEERKVDAQMTEVEKTEYELDDLVEGTEKELLLVSFGTSYLDTLEKRLEKSIAIWKNSSLIMWWRMLLQAR